MPQYDVFRTSSVLLLDCQSDALGYLATRLTVPLLPPDRAPERRARLNPTFEIDGDTYVLVTQFAAAVGTRELKSPVTNLASRHLDIISAFDMLLTGV